jgi:transaldolase
MVPIVQDCGQTSSIMFNFRRILFPADFSPNSTVKALVAPVTVNTMPKATLKALAKHEELGSIMSANRGDCEEVLAKFTKAGMDLDALSAQLHEDGAKSFVKSRNDLMSVIASGARRAEGRAS